MQAKLVHEGAALDYTPVAAQRGGDIVEIGALTGMVKSNIAANALGAVAVTGIFDIVKKNEQIDAGALVYWDNDGDPVGGTAGTGCATVTSTNNTVLGRAVATALAATGTVRVYKFNAPAVTNSIQNPVSSVIADPGNAGAIPVTNSGNVAIVTAAAETRTIAAPSAVGQMLSIYLKTDGGDCVITVATAINQTGNTTITLNDAGDSILLVAIENGANKRWRVAYNDGCTLG